MNNFDLDALEDHYEELEKRRKKTARLNRLNRDFRK